MRKNINDQEFISFLKIQNDYPRIEEMTNDLHLMNNEAEKYAEFFNIDIDKWKIGINPTLNKSFL